MSSATVRPVESPARPTVTHIVGTCQHGRAAAPRGPQRLAGWLLRSRARAGQLRAGGLAPPTSRQRFWSSVPSVWSSHTTRRTAPLASQQVFCGRLCAGSSAALVGVRAAPTVLRSNQRLSHGVPRPLGQQHASGAAPRARSAIRPLGPGFGVFRTYVALLGYVTEVGR